MSIFYMKKWKNLIDIKEEAPAAMPPMGGGGGMPGMM